MFVHVFIIDNIPVFIIYVLISLTSGQDSAVTIAVFTIYIYTLMMFRIHTIKYNNIISYRCRINLQWSCVAYIHIYVYKLALVTVYIMYEHIIIVYTCDAAKLDEQKNPASNRNENNCIINNISLHKSKDCS